MADTIATVLLIEDEVQIRRFLRATLTSQNYLLLEAETAKQGLTEAANHPPDLILLDLGLPDADGLDVIRQLREWTQVPIIVLSARGQESDKVAALDLGADDYLTKPFGVPELNARMRVALRHAATSGDAESAVYERGMLKIDLAKRQVFVANEEKKLTPIEFKLLGLLVKHAGKVLTHKQILKDVWGPHFTEENHYLRVFVHQLRQKVEPEPARPKFLLTETGIGYRLVDMHA